ncbi:MAG TPA: hypothetical protein VN719_14885, partial [Gemmatimonadales bacterium]|nr:hypothetical protein [Gemmatimonadales bacterium]
AVLNAVAAIRPSLLKRAEVYVPFGPVPWADSPYKDIERALELVYTAREKQAEADRQGAQYEAVRRRYYGEPGPEAGFHMERAVQPPLEKIALGPFGTALSVGLLRDVSSNLGQALSNPFTPASKEDAINSAMGKIGDPDHEQELRDIASRATLAQLMADDDVVGAHQPHQVVQAFNDVSQVAPRLAQQPILLEGLLRRRLEQGAFDPFEGKQIVETERQVRHMGQPPTEKR